MAYIMFRRAVAVAILGLSFATTAFAAGSPLLPASSNEAWSSCTESFCIDAPPPDGSGGWGFNSAINAPVTTLPVGTPATLTVTVLQPAGNCANGTITLTWHGQDFSYVSNGDTSATCSNPFSFTGPASIWSCSYTDLSHTSKSDSFISTPLNPTPNALITATVSACGEEASETFPVAIVKKYYH
jgi:hypothetical protein